MCLQSWPLAGSWIRLNVIGHFRDTLMAVCSTPSSPFRPGVPGMVPLLKFLFTETKREGKNAQIILIFHEKVERLLRMISNNKIFCICWISYLMEKQAFQVKVLDCDLLLVMQCSAGRSLFFIKPCRTDLTDGRWTNCSTNRWDYKSKE